MKEKLQVMKKSVWSRLCLILVILLIGSQSMAQLVHPGISHKKSDLDRMKAMVEAGEEPWASSFEKFKEQGSASYNYNVNGNLTITTLDNAADSRFLNDGYAAYHNALMWYITGDERHAQKCVEIFNAWVNLTSTGGIALSQGRGPWKMCEGAEIIKHTYNGWSEEDQKKFGDMLVYPGWSGTETPTGSTTFYWGVYQGDPSRHGNQGLFAYRSLMAMGIFLDNEIIYERALRYLKGLPHRADDLPYPSGPPVTEPLTTGNEYYEEFRQVSIGNEIEDYGYNEVIENYIYENGQCQESSRDQTHTVVGVLIMNCISEMAWNQGDDLYGHLDNRQLLGLEFTMRYNLSWEHAYPDQPEPWEPTVESGEYIQRTDRSGRWRSLKINPYVANNLEPENFERGTNTLMPIYEMNLGHYKDRMMLPSEDYKWMQRGFEVMTEEIGVEDGKNAVDYPGWGGLKFRRVSPGDPVSGYDEDGLPMYQMNVVPGSIEAENFDHFALSGEGKVYHDVDDSNTSGEYRTDEGVDIAVCSEGGYQVESLEDGEWVTYTVQVPATSLYNISIRYASASAGGKIKFSFSNEEVTEEITVPNGVGYSTGLDDWQDLAIANDVILRQGVQPMKISISGTSDSFVLNSISIEDGSPHECEGGLAAVDASDRFVDGVNYSYYEGTWDNLPDFERLSPAATDIADEIGLIEGVDGEQYALVFEGHFSVPINGTYTFYTESADGSRLLVDGVEVVNNDGVHDVVEASGEVCLDEGYHQIVVEYFHNAGDQALAVMYAGPTVSKQVLSETYATGACGNEPVETPDNLEEGISYVYYEGQWNSLPDFSTLTPVEAGNLDQISLSPSRVDNYFAMTFDGYINIEEEADYTFYVSSDDGSKLYIDDMEIIDHDGLHGAEDERSGTICLNPGYHHLYIEYFEATGGNSISVMYEGGSVVKQLISEVYTGAAHEKIAQVIAFPEFPKVVVGDDDFDPGATVDSGRPLSYTSSNPSVATIVAEKVHVVSNGITTITASQEGSWEYAPVETSQELNVYSVAGCELPWTMPTVVVKNQTYEFTSEPIDISCVSSVSIYLKLLATSGLTADDFVKVSYQVDGGEVLAMLESTGVDSNGEFSSDEITGNNVRVIITASSSTPNGTYQMTDISVKEYTIEEPVLSSDPEASGVGVYPNPASETMTMNINKGVYSTYRIFTIHGQVMKEGKIAPSSSQEILDVSTFPQGVYILKLYGGQAPLSLKVLKQ
ncbi:PA14 domain-containing protein [Reichenbachiella sp. MSK19-1]|uniref:PA14 domain-containing protein n=1 Tax=Reichenbachiella sp. MSK19-1 TaxID=1897631 RepID=UPI000E6D1D31|nr:PA14 domain-containing protein [Reichenbachiella sp. MSK19-1]